MEPVDLNSMVTNPHDLKDHDIVKGKSARQQKSSGSQPLAQSPWRGEVQVRASARSLILEPMWKKFLVPTNPIFKKRVIPTQNSNSLRCPLCQDRCRMRQGRKAGREREKRK